MTIRSAATACCSDNEASPLLVERAIGQAMEKAGLRQANGVVLFLNGFGKQHATPAIRAAARSARCLQIFGAAAAGGVFTENGWTIDRPAAAVLVLGRELGLTGPSQPTAPPDVQITPAGLLENSSACLTCIGNHTFPSHWHGGMPRFGAVFNDPASHEAARIWRAGRLSEDHRFECRISGATPHLALSTGWRALGQMHTVTGSSGYNIHTLDGMAAHDVLHRELPIDFRIQPSLPLYAVAAVVPSPGGENSAPPKRIEQSERIIPILSSNADGSFTLAEPVGRETGIYWAIRQPVPTENDMRQALADIRGDISPLFAIALSSIGRGPCFYGGEDRDLLALKIRFPGLPILGAYATAQIAPSPPAHGTGNHLLHNAVVTAVYTAN